MKEKEARKVVGDILRICVEYGLHCEIKEIRKPQLAFIKFEEISIKVDKGDN